MDVIGNAIDGDGIAVHPLQRCGHPGVDSFSEVVGEKRFTPVGGENYVEQKVGAGVSHADGIHGNKQRGNPHLCGGKASRPTVRRGWFLSKTSAPGFAALHPGLDYHAPPYGGAYHGISFRIGRRTSCDLRSPYTFLNANTAFNPPKANEFDSAVRISRGRAWFGVTSRSHSGSGVV